MTNQAQSGDPLRLRPSTDDDVHVMLDIAQRGYTAVTGRDTRWSEEGLRRMRQLPGRDAGRDFPVVVRRDPQAPAGRGRTSRRWRRRASHT